MKFKAIVVGATGLIGKHLIEYLLKEETCESITVFVRRKSPWNKHPKVNEKIIDFTRLNDYQSDFKGDVLFSCLGTTLKQAGSREKQMEVDYGYQLKCAQLAKNNHVEQFVLVSSPWANNQSKNYYRKMKAVLEKDVLDLHFKKTIILKPNGLMGHRETKRFGESFGFKAFAFLSRIFTSLKKHQPILGSDVAKAMLLSFLQSKKFPEIKTLSRTEINDFINQSDTPI
jgi:uncharacterized protein YbjT (DUF2867 family)